MSCINIRSKDFIQLMEETNLPSIVLEFKINKWQSDNNTDEFPSVSEMLKSNQVNTTLKSIDILSSDKAKQVFDKGNKNGWDLNKILTELQVPKEQKQLILDKDIKDREEIITSLFADNSFVVEVNTAIDKDLYIDEETRYSKENDKYFLDSLYSGKKEITEEEFNIGTKQLNSRNSKIYSNLTVPGGTNYTENEIATPDITPNIKGHAQFATDNGIGWFRSDEQSSNSFLTKEEATELSQLQQELDDEGLNNKDSDRLNELSNKGNFSDIEGSKTRRILELQSDLFQKGRDRDNLVGLKSDLSSQEEDSFQRHLLETGQITQEEFDNPPVIESLNKENKFLQLLNKNSNWVTFFVKSIIQDSVKKGYEKVLFPSGNTASKVEGHSTLEEFKERKEDNIKTLEEIKFKKLSEINEAEIILNNINVIDSGESSDIGKYTYDNSISVDLGSKEFSVNLDFVNRNDPKELYEYIEDTKKELRQNKEKYINSIDKDITKIKEEIKETENESIASLKPIYNFYENTVTNILNKTYGKDNVTLITDEHGNTWNEITLEEKRDSSAIFMKEVNFQDLVDPNLTYETDTSERTPSSNILFNGKQGKITVDEILENILNNYDNLSPKGKELYQKARKLIGKTAAKVKFVNESQYSAENVLMDIESDTNNIRLNRDRLNKYDVDTIVEGFIHELAHAQSLHALLNPQTFEEKEFKKLMEEMFAKYKSLSNGSKAYGFENVKEFVSEIYASSEFRAELKQLDKDNNTTYWKKFIEAVRRLFQLAKTKETNDLIEQVIDFVEQDGRDRRGMNLQRLLFAKKVESDSKFTKIEDKLTNVIKKAQDKIDGVYDRAKSSTHSKSEEDKQKHLGNIKELVDELEKYSTVQQWKAILGYTKSFKNTVNTVDNLLNNLLKTKDPYKDDLIETLDRWDEYLASYDLLKDITDLVVDSKIEMSKLSEIDIADIEMINLELDEINAKHGKINDLIFKVKQIQALKFFADPKNNTEVETKWRKKLTAEFNELSNKKGLNVNEYVARMLATRDKDDYESDLMTSAEKLVNDPSIDISYIDGRLSDTLNTNSRIVQVLSNIFGQTRDKIIEVFRQKDMKMSNLYDKFIKEKGNKRPSELYKNIIEKDSEGNGYLLGEYSIKFKEKYDNEFRPLSQQRQELIKTKLEEGLTQKEIKKLVEYKDINKKMSAWFKSNTVKDKSGNTIPNPKYLNKQPAGLDLELLNQYKQIDKDNVDKLGKRGSLITTLFGADFHQLPSMTKDDLERRIEMDVKGLTKDKITDFTKVKVDDLGIESKDEAINSRNQIMRDVKIHYRGKLDPSQQSYDLNTMYRKEFWNGVNYQEKSKIQPTVNIIADIVKGKDYYKKSTRTGKIARNMFNVRSPEQTFKGEFSNEHARIVGLIERNLYDTFSNYGGKTFFGTDMNKTISAINGWAATTSMALNIASGTANIANGFTQLFIESIGGDRFNKSTLLKAELKYTKDLPNIFGDLTNPTKKSFTNQLLQMFDVVGGLELAEQESLRNNFLRKFGSTKMLNFINESGEHAMHSVLTMAVLDTLKVMNSNQEYIDKEGNVVSEEKAASMLDMLYMKDGVLTMSDKTVYSKHNLTTQYHEGGKTHINLLIKKQVFDIFGVYDANFKNEVSKHWLGKSVMMFKNFFISGAQYRYRGIGQSLTKSEDLNDDDLFYSSAEKEYLEGTYTTLIRFFKNGVVPNLKSLSLMYQNYNSLSDYEKANLKKATIEIMLTAVLLPAAGMLLAGAAPDSDDDELWFAIYITRRLESELSQFRNPIEASRMIQNPIAGIRIVQNMLNFTYDVITPIDFVPDESKNENFFSYMNEDSKGKNKLGKGAKKLVPIWNQMEKNYQNMYNLQFK